MAATVLRASLNPGETLGDRVSTHRGMSIKVFGVEGEKLPGHLTDTQDFVFATGTTFPSGTAKGFLRDAKQIGAATPLPELVRFGDVCFLGASGEEFVRAVERAVGEAGDAGRREVRREVARGHTWWRRAAEFAEVLGAGSVEA